MKAKTRPIEGEELGIVARPRSTSSSRANPEIRWDGRGNRRLQLHKAPSTVPTWRIPAHNTRQG